MSLLGVTDSVAVSKDPKVVWENVDQVLPAKATYHAKEDCEVSFKKGDDLHVLKKTRDWLRVQHVKTGQRGLCPVAYVDLPADRNSSMQLLGMLDNMFDESMATSGANTEDEDFNKEPELHEEFMFDNIMNEIMAEKEKLEKESQASKSGGGDVGGSNDDLTLSSISGRGSTGDNSDWDDLDLPLPSKPLPKAPPAADLYGDDKDDDPFSLSAAPPPVVPPKPTSLRQSAQQLQGKGDSQPAPSASPRSPRRTLNPPSANPSSPTGATATSPTPTVSLPATGASEGSARKSAAAAKTPSVSIPQTTRTPSSSSLQVPQSSSPQPSPSPTVSRSAARPVAKILGDDGTYKCPKCMTVVGKDATFCKHCGTSLKQVSAEQCVQCKVVLRPGAVVCHGCGARASASSLPGLSMSPPTAVPPATRLSARPSSPQPQGPAKTPAPGPISPRRSAQPLSHQPSAQPSQLSSSLSAVQQQQQQQQQQQPAAEAEKTRIIMVGSGTSTGTPSLKCLTSTRCKVCLDALTPGSKNRRRNTSLLIQHRGKNILIDCGKSFREGWIEVIEKYGVKELDAVLITHAHADAFLGLDDLRELSNGRSIPIFCTQKDREQIETTFPYLADTKKATGSHYVANLQFQTIPDRGPFEIHGLKFRGIPLPHGDDCTALGFQFGPIVYMSDVSHVPDKVFEFLEKLPNFRVLIIDAITIKSLCQAHLNLPQALAVIQQAKPQMAILTGLSHEFFYSDVRRVLKKVNEKEGISVKVGFDLLNFSFESDMF